MLLLRFPNQQNIQNLIQVEDAKKLIENVIYLMKQKTNLKSLGIKIGSYIQKIEIGELRQHKLLKF